MVVPAGIEPATRGFSVLCSTDWATEPLAVWTGLEPATSAVTGRHSNQLNYQTNGCGRRIWTNDLRVMSPTSYQTAPSRDITCLFTFGWIFIKMARDEGFEPPRDVNPLSVFKTDPFSRTWVIPRIVKLVDPVGLEPTTDRLWADSSNQLS